MDLLPLLRDRYSVRAFSDRPIEPETLDRVLSVAGISPTARNKQPQRLYVLESDEARAKIAELSPCTFGAPVVLMMCFDRSEASPTARNKQPQRLYVLESDEARAKIAELSPCTFGAPVVLMMCFDRSEASDSKLNPGYDFGEMDASICLNQVMLAAWAEGLGSCWVGMFSQEEVRVAFDLPESYHVAALMPLGYPAEDAHPGPMHEKSRPLGELVTRL